ncbi:MAG TPA: hypothetical protein VIX58_09465, partial [Anaerolineae bacterium]
RGLKNRVQSQGTTGVVATAINPGGLTRGAVAVAAVVAIDAAAVAVGLVGIRPKPLIQSRSDLRSPFRIK